MDSPIRSLPDAGWQHFTLYQSVREALYSLPNYFRTETWIEGISATDIFTLNSALGATIENQVVNTLNQMRSIWDPDEKYLLYSFFRQAQTFPDVLLRKSTNTESLHETILLGIELKGWYLLAKEGEPSFRFQVTPDACAVQDLIVVVPWALNNVISGSPRIFTPYIESAHYAARYRNHHWTNLRDAKSDRDITSPAGVTPYPKKSDLIADKPMADSGGNFGRFSRTGIMDAYLEQAKQTILSGIGAEHWLHFFQIFQDNRSKESIATELIKLKKRIGETTVTQSNSEFITTIQRIITEFEHLLKTY